MQAIMIHQLPAPNHIVFACTLMYWLHRKFGKPADIRYEFYCECRCKHKATTYFGMVAWLSFLHQAPIILGEYLRDWYQIFSMFLEEHFEVFKNSFIRIYLVKMQKQFCQGTEARATIQNNKILFYNARANAILEQCIEYHFSSLVSLCNLSY